MIKFAASIILSAAPFIACEASKSALLTSSSVSSSGLMKRGLLSFLLPGVELCLGA